MTNGLAAASNLAGLRKKLEIDPSAGSRADVGAGVGREFAAASLTPAERRVAEEILAVVAADVSEMVRSAVADSVRHCAFLPRETALMLAHDVAIVALPFLEYSPALSDEDLLQLIGEGGADRHCAIASRREVSEEVSGALVATGDRQVVGALLGNPGARIAGPTYGHVLDGFGNDSEIQALLTERPDLPVRIAMRMVHIVSDELRERLVARHDLPPELAADLAISAGEHAATEILAGIGENASDDDHTSALRVEGLLQPGLAFRALCARDSRPFISALADRADLPALRVWAMLNDPGGGGFRMVYEMAGLPPLLSDAFRIVLGLLRENSAIGPAEWESLVVGRLVAAYDHLAPGDIENVLSQFALRLRLETDTGPCADARKTGNPGRRPGRR